MSLNFNTQPYYDDFDENKNFHKILFKPGAAVQARELTQSQTILQDQIGKLGKFVLADGIMSGHMSEMPVGTYKKAHRHGPGTHVICVTGHGYSLLWYEGDADFTRIEWQHGVVFPPCQSQIHQHFNTSAEPARYLAMGIGNVRYPFTLQKRQTMIGEKGAKQRSSLSIKQGGNQIEFEDQDPRIHALWLEEMHKAGITPRMDKYFPA